MGQSRGHNRRGISVDAVTYRYRVSPDDGFISLLVRLEGGRGQLLRVNFPYRDDWVAVGGGASTSAGHRLILPRVVRLAILDGLRRGWVPAASHPGVFRVDDGDGLLTDEEWPRFRKSCTRGEDVASRLDAPDA